MRPNGRFPSIPLPEGDSYLGFIFVRGKTIMAEAALRQACYQLHFEIAPKSP